ncbi:FAD:protein FMN transferase, partial [Candidatus Nomurabacteria bacterium]|nr:FAD:protein FMN transferase [Candidatus Nomurabacteria bacterium]
YKAVTVVHPDSGVCDVLSTALMLMPWDEGSAFLAGITDADAYWILSDGSVKTTAGMDSILLSGESGS